MPKAYTGCPKKTDNLVTLVDETQTLAVEMQGTTDVSQFTVVTYTQAVSTDQK